MELSQHEGPKSPTVCPPARHAGAPVVCRVMVDVFSGYYVARHRSARRLVDIILERRAMDGRALV